MTATFGWSFRLCTGRLVALAENAEACDAVCHLPRHFFTRASCILTVPEYQPTFRLIRGSEQRMPFERLEQREPARQRYEAGGSIGPSPYWFDPASLGWTNR